MEHTLDLEHDGKRAFCLNGKRVLCLDAVKRNSDKPFQVRATAYDHAVGNSERIVVRKTDATWVWPNARFKYPLAVYQGGLEVLNSFFPNAQPNEEKEIWVKIQVLKNKK